MLIIKWHPADVPNNITFSIYSVTCLLSPLINPSFFNWSFDFSPIFFSAVCNLSLPHHTPLLLCFPFCSLPSPSLLASHIFDYSALCKMGIVHFHLLSYLLCLSLVGLTILYLATFSLSLLPPCPSCFHQFPLTVCSTASFSSPTILSLFAIFFQSSNTLSLYHSLLCVTGLIYFHFQFNGGSSTVFCIFNFNFSFILDLVVWSATFTTTAGSKNKFTVKNN